MCIFSIPLLNVSSGIEEKDQHAAAENKRRHRNNRNKL